MISCFLAAESENEDISVCLLRGVYSGNLIQVRKKSERRHSHVSSGDM